jgi:predicted AlkP superfamily pyrophosphatase or phosphodiesterase
VDTLHPIVPPSIDTSKFAVTYGGTMIHLYAKDKNAIGPASRSLKRDADYYVYLPDETPERWHYRTKDDRYDRIGDILLVAHYPRVFETRGHVLAGEHGYDPMIPDMGATFYAWGPAFRRGMTIATFENVNVYPLIAHILGLGITQPIDGSEKVLSGILK